MTKLIARLQTAWLEASERATAEAESGEVAEKVIIVAGFTLIALAIVAAITALVNGKLAGISF
ncbi:MAG: hypothetical protein AB7R77_16255 [Ilumatobacteraceae bacterium]